MITLTCGASAAAARDGEIIQENVSSCDVTPMDLYVAEYVRLCHDHDRHPSKNKQIFQARKGRDIFQARIVATLLIFWRCLITSSARPAPSPQANVSIDVISKASPPLEV